RESSPSLHDGNPPIRQARPRRPPAAEAISFGPLPGAIAPSPVLGFSPLREPPRSPPSICNVSIWAFTPVLRPSPSSRTSRQPPIGLLPTVCREIIAGPFLPLPVPSTNPQIDHSINKKNRKNDNSLPPQTVLRGSALPQLRPLAPRPVFHHR